MKKTIMFVLVVVALGAAYFAFGRKAEAPAPLEEAANAGPAVPGDNLTLGEGSDPALGTYLAGYNGMTLYSYAPDTAGVSNCSGGCAANWPPYVVTSTANLVAESPIAGTVGTLTRADGSTQVTYNGVPLYFYIKDAQPGDETGQGVGGVWYVVKP
jgi:predicted lipoprotein with Yx(FWY)xxD motif